MDHGVVYPSDEFFFSLFLQTVMAWSVRKIGILALIVALVAVLFLTVLGKLDVLVFWAIVILAAFFAFKVLPNWKEK